MMGGPGIITFIIILTTVLFSIRGFASRDFYDHFKFDVGRITMTKEYYRFFSSGLLHVGWMHLFWNMLSLFLFSSGLEAYLGAGRYLAIYLAGLAGGNLLAFLIHKKHGNYTSVGASGAVNGVIYATIAFFPNMSIGLFFLPLHIPAWIFGLVYVLISMYGIKSRRDNVGHEAHLGGALIGMLMAILMDPGILATNYLPILLIALPSIAFIYIIINKPHLLLVDNLFYKRTHRFNVEDRYNLEKRLEQTEIDRILEKIHKKGIKSLTKKEREILNEYSKAVK